MPTTEEDGPAAGLDNRNSDAEDEDEVDLSITFPAPSTAIAKEMNKINSTEQRTNTTQLFAFLTGTNGELSQLNALENKPAACLINIPQTDHVRVIYSLGFGTSPIGQVSLVANKILAFTGDGDSSNPPAVMVLPKDMVELVTCLTPSQEDFDTKMDEPGNTQYPWFKTSQLTNTSLFPKIMPIPAFIVYDGFEKDLDAVTVYKRVQALANRDVPSMIALSAFLRGCMTARLKNDTNTYASSQVFMAAPSPAARGWGVQKLISSFPALTRPQMPGPSPSTDPNMALMAALLKSLQPQEGKKDSPATTKPENDDKFGMSNSELTLMLLFCGLNEGEEALLPVYLELMNEKNASDSRKEQILLSQLKNNEFYEGARVYVSKMLLKLLKKRKYLSEDPELTYRTAGNGVTLFSVGHQDLDEVAAINELFDQLTEATMVMPSDISKLGKMTATVPETAADFMMNLRVFANLLYALFTGTCPLFKQLKELIKALANYNPKALKQMTKKTRGSILWIITLQTRHFFRGEISILAEFQLMKNKLTARDPLIYHAEVPDILIEEKTITGDKRSSFGDEEKRDGGNATKKQKASIIHPLFMKHFIHGIWKNNPALIMRDITQHCNTNVPTIVQDHKACLLAMFGRCKNPNCNKKHRAATDAEAKFVCDTLEKAIKNPEDIKKSGVS